MDKLKTYAIPLVGLLVLLGYWFVVRPMLADQAASSPASDTRDAKDSNARGK